MTSAAESANTSRERDPNQIVRAAWPHLQDACQWLNRSEMLEPIRLAVERFELGLFRLVVMGEI